MIHRMAGSPSLAEQHFRHVDRVDALDLARRKAMATAGRGKKLAVEAKAVVRNKRGITRPDRELAQYFLRPVRMPHMPVSNPGIAFDEG